MDSRSISSAFASGCAVKIDEESFLESLSLSRWSMCDMRGFSAIRSIVAAIVLDDWSDIVWVQVIKLSSPPVTSDTVSASFKPQYFLKTAPVLSSATNSRFGNLYLRHHSGGINAIMAMPSPPKFIKANSSTDPSRVLFTSAAHPERQWGFVLWCNTNAREDKLGAWEEVLNHC